MSNLSPNASPSPGTTLSTPSWVLGMLLASPLLIFIGAVITINMLPYVVPLSSKLDAILIAVFGAIALAVGVTFLIAGITVVGVEDPAMLEGTVDARCAHNVAAVRTAGTAVALGEDAVGLSRLTIRPTSDTLGEQASALPRRACQAGSWPMDH